MKRRKKQNDLSGRLCLFDVSTLRQEKESRTKPKKKPIEALKPSALTLIPPTAEKAIKRQENGLKMEILSKDKLSRFWKEDSPAPEAVEPDDKKEPYHFEISPRVFINTPKMIC